MGLFDFFKKKKNVKEEQVVAINEKLKEILESLARNEILIKMDELGEVVNPWSSKVGGRPFLPKSFVWPTFTYYGDGVTRPLSFICQINLEELKEYDKDNLLPKKGMLYFFYECESLTWGFDSQDKEATRVFYFADTTDFVELELPVELEEHNRIPEIAISFENRMAYPSYEEFHIYNDSEYDFEEYDAVLENLGVDLEEEEVSKLLGYANIIQDEMLTECERISRDLYCGDSESYQNTPEALEKEIEQCAKEWVLLFQIDTITKDDFEMMFGDCGKLYVYIKKTDLENGNFNNISFAVQCY